MVVCYFLLFLCIGILAKTRAQTATQAALCAAEFLMHVGDLDFKQIETGKRRLSEYYQRFT